MSRENVEVVRTPIAPDARLPTRRTLDERLFVRWPWVWAALARAAQRLPPRSPLRRGLLRRGTLAAWAAWARRDVDVFLLRYAPECRIEVPADFIAAGQRPSYRGHAGVHELVADLREAWEREYFIPPGDILDAGNPVIFRSHYRRCARSGAEFDVPFASVVWFERGLTVHERQFTDWDEALRAAGIPAVP
jgi:ketosteroid isomerase-like protein